MTDEQALLTAILANRADDTPRLAFADYLENDAYTLQPERGEFIRVQCELARWGGCDWKTKHIRAGYVDCDQWNDLLGEGRVMTWCPTCARRNELRRRERELLEAHELEWMVSPLDELVAANIADVVVNRASLNIPGWSRGFVSSLTCSWSDWRTHADAILARQPVEKVTLTTLPDVPPLDDEPEHAAELRDMIGPGTNGIIWERRIWHYLGREFPGIEFELPPLDVVIGPTFQVMSAT